MGKFVHYLGKFSINHKVAILKCVKTCLLGKSKISGHNLKAERPNKLQLKTTSTTYYCTKQTYSPLCLEEIEED
jgi:hypothetical protein